jgi:hypothetical protein
MFPLLGTFLRCWSLHRSSTFSIPRTIGVGFRMRLAKHTGQLKYAIKSPMPKPCVGIMLHDIIFADLQISGNYDPRFEGLL